MNVELPRRHPGVTYTRMVIFLAGPMSQAGTLSDEQVRANIDAACAQAVEIEEATGHIVLVPHLDFLRPHPANGTLLWRTLQQRHMAMLATQTQGMFVMPYEQSDVEVIEQASFWLKARANIIYYTRVDQIPIWKDHLP